MHKNAVHDYCFYNFLFFVVGYFCGRLKKCSFCFFQNSLEEKRVLQFQNFIVRVVLSFLFSFDSSPSPSRSAHISEEPWELELACRICPRQ